jgi:hypothetical protein
MAYRSWILAAALGALTVLLPSSAAADGTLYMGLGAGPAFNLNRWPTQVRTEFEIGYYFEDNPPGGFFLSFAPSASFLSHRLFFVFPLRLGGMFTLVRNSNMAFQLGPTGTVGFAVSGCYDDDRCDPKPWFHFSVAFMLRLLFADERVAFYVRPVEFEFAFGDDDGFWGGDAWRYVIAGGFQFHFD